MRWPREVPPPPALTDLLRARALQPSGDAVAAALAGHVTALGNGTVRAVAFFGSRHTGARPGAQSAYDLLVVVSAYRPFYAALSAAGAARRGPGVLAALNAWLPPSQIALRGPATAPDARAKCAVISADDLRQATSSTARDHFCLGRLAQQAQMLAWSTDGADDIVHALARAHALTYSWVRPWLPESFDVDAYCRTFLRVSYAGEIRPEPSGRADALASAQAPYLHDAYAPLLAALAAQGELVERAPGTYMLAAAATPAERRRAAGYFRWSKVRATARWAKYVVTFDDWLEFIVAKARRHSGQPIDLTERERRHPLLFLWPRVFQYLRNKDGAAPGGRR